MNVFVSATATTPVAFRAGRDDLRQGTLGYVPGSALWGGLAGAHARLRPTRRNEFATFFLQQRVRFGNLYPSRFSQANAPPNPLDEDQSPVRPIPRTARSCKRFGGFRFHHAEDGDDRHGVQDSLLAWAAFALSGANDPAELTRLRDCQHCREPLDTYTGFYRHGSGAGEWGAAETRKGIFTRTGVSRARGSAEEGALYSREFLHSGSRFCGVWWVEDALSHDLEDFVAEAAESGLLRVGHTRTRGLGKLAFPDQLRQLAPDTADDIEARALRFDSTLRQSLGAAARHALYLPLILTSDCISDDGAGRYRLRITSDTLAEVWGIPGADLVYSNAGRRRVSGWNGIWGLPKADEWAITMGSVFLFGLAGKPDWQALAEGQAKGLGVRRSEGFGEVRIADEFHYEVKGS